MATDRICSIPGCGKPLCARGWCQAHYKRWKASGDPGTTPIRKASDFTVPQWVEAAAKITQQDCLIWPFCVSERGYGKFRADGWTQRAHRAVCELAHGPAPQDKPHAAHRCGNRLCCNPAHLYWATASENQLDRVAHGTSNRGKRQWMAALSEEQVLQICALLDQGRGHTSIGRDFGVSRNAIRAIDIGNNWGWLTGRQRVERSRASEAASAGSSSGSSSPTA